MFTRVVLAASLVALAACAGAADPSSTTAIPEVTATEQAPVTSSPSETAEGTQPGSEGAADPLLERVVSYGGSGFDYANAVAVGGDGIYTGIVYLSPESDNGDLVITRHDADGNLQWATMWGGPLEDGALRGTISVTEGWGVVAAAASYDAALRERDVALLRLDGEGAVLWQLGAIAEGEQRPHGVLVDEVAITLLIGHDEGDGNSNHIILTRLTLDGEVLWQRSFQGDGANDWGYTLESAPDGSILIGGRATVAGEAQALVAKFSAEGSLLWAREWGEANRPERVTDVRADAEGNLYVAGPVVGVGNGGDSTFVVKLSPGGDLVWSRKWQLPSNEVWAHGAALAGDRLVLSGFVRTFGSGVNSLGNSGYLLEVSTDGTLGSQVLAGSVKKESAEAIAWLGEHLIVVGQGGGGEQQIARLDGVWLSPDVELRDRDLVETNVELPWQQLDFPSGPAPGIDGVAGEADAQITWISYP